MSPQLASVLAGGTPSQSRDSAGLLRVRPPAVLMELVERFRVCWETLPEVIVIDQEIRQVGFALELYGTHEPEDVDHHTQCCSHCQNVFATLHVIADWILPPERKVSMYEAEVSSPSINHSHARRLPSVVTFTIRIVRREGYEGAARDSEIQWLRELEERLKELGAVKAEIRASEHLEGGWDEREK